MRPVVLAAFLAAVPVAALAQTSATDDLAEGVRLRTSGRPAEAVAPLERAARAHPADADVWLNLGLAQAASGHLAEAERSLDRADALAPTYLDVQIARARLAYFRGDLTEARRRLAPALAAQPDNPEARELAARIAAAAAQPGEARWRLDAAWTQGFLSEGLSDAHSAVVALNRTFSGYRSIGGSIEQVRQFGQGDTYLEVTAASPRGLLALGGAPDADFRPRVAVRAGLAGPVWRLGAWSLQPDLNLGWARYPAGEVYSLSPGLGLSRGAGWSVAGRWINVRDEREQIQSGYSVRADWRAAPRLALYAGWANAPESDEGRTVRVKTASVGVAVDVTDRLTLRLSGDHETRRAYDRDNLTLGVTHRF